MSRYQCTQPKKIKLLASFASTKLLLIFADPPFNIGYDYDIYDNPVMPRPSLELESEPEVYEFCVRTSATVAYSKIVIRVTNLPLILKSQFHPGTVLVTPKLGDLVLYVWGPPHQETHSQLRPLFHFVKDPKRFTSPRPAREA